MHADCAWSETECLLKASLGFKEDDMLVQWREGYRRAFAEPSCSPRLFVVTGEDMLARAETMLGELPSGSERRGLDHLAAARSSFW